jgi:trk system potassium uptake protein TrkH
MRKEAEAVRGWWAGLGVPSRILAGFALYLLLGWGALSLPICQKQSMSLIETLFAAVSGLSTTGLAARDVESHFTGIGQWVLLMLLQAGALGFMTLGSFLVMARWRELPAEMAGVVRGSFDLPPGISTRRFLRSAVAYSFSVEAAGVLALAPMLAAEGVERPIWNALFIVVSGFANAGMNLLPQGLEPFRGHAGVNAVVVLVGLAGALGFLVSHDIWLLIARRRRPTLTTIVVLSYAALAWPTAAAGIMAAERGRLGPMEAFAQAASALTTCGFNTVPISELSAASHVWLMALMVVGLGTSGTSGGLKATTLFATGLAVLSVLRGRGSAELRGLPVPPQRLLAAQAVAGMYGATTFAGVLALAHTQELPLGALIFESISALSNGGLSLGITGELNSTGLMIVSGLMFAGRLGPLSLALAVLPLDQPTEDCAKQDLVIDV